MDFSSQRHRAPLFLDLTPLIDVVFLLLIFFMVSTTFVTDATGMRVDLPRSSSQEAIPEGSDLTLQLESDGSVTLDDRSLSSAQLSAELRKAAEADPNTLIVLRADTELAHGRVVEVMDLARGIGLTSFAIATESAGTAPAPSTGDAIQLPSWMKRAQE